MNEPADIIDKVTVYRELVHFFEAYRQLTQRLETAVEERNQQAAQNMLLLRQETIRRVEELQKRAGKARVLTEEDQRNEELMDLARQSANILAECREIEERIMPTLASMHLDLQNQAAKLKQGGKALKGYANAGVKAVKPNSEAVYVEEKK